MPLIGRHKGAPKDQTNSATSTQATATETHRQQVCESPLFGLRRQLSFSSQEPSRPANEQVGSIPQQITRQQIHYAFSILDVNKDGMIDPRDMSQMLANLGLPIDEAILSHLMVTVSKRGDHKISESEFLDWIAQLIQINDSPKSSQGSLTADVSRAARREARREARTVSRTARATSSLGAQLPEEPTRGRRGSGSGLALMRSLSGSSSSSSTQALPTANEHSTTPPAVVDGLQEARNDLRAAFCVFDLDGDGFITLEEVRAGLQLLGENWSAGELRRLFTSCPKSSGPAESSQQRISIDDFVRLLL